MAFPIFPRGSSTPHSLLTNGFLHGLLLPLAWLLPVHGIAFTFHRGCVERFVRGIPWDPHRWGCHEAPEPAWWAAALAAVMVAGIAAEAFRRWLLTWRDPSVPRLDGFWRGLLVGLLCYLAVRQVVSAGMPDADGESGGGVLFASLLRMAASVGLIWWILRSTLCPIRTRSLTWESSGFVQAASIVLIWMVGVHQLWWSPAFTGLDYILFSEAGPRWSLLPMRTQWGSDLFNVAALLSAFLLVDLVRKWLSRASRRKGPVLDAVLSGVAFALLVHLGLQQMGAETTWRHFDDPPWHVHVWTHLRFVLFWSGALLVLLSEVRRIHGPRAPFRWILGAGSAVIAVGALVMVPVSVELDEAEDWTNARICGSAACWDDFVRAHPRSRRLGEVRHRTWKRVLEGDILEIQDYLRNARGWGDRLDSARLLAAAWYSAREREVLAKPFALDAEIDAFWRSRLPDTSGPYAGSSIVRYELEFEEGDLERDAARLQRSSTARILVPWDSFDLTGSAWGARPVERALDSVVHPWAPPVLLTIAPVVDTSLQTPRLRIRVRPRLVGPLEPVPCEPGCPLDDRDRVLLPVLAYDWTIALRFGPDSVIVTRGTALDTSFAADWRQSSCTPDEDCRWLGIGLQEAWERRRERSLDALAASIREAWRVVPASP